MDACVFEHDMAWKQRGEWMDVPNYIAHHRICNTPCNLLTALLSAMKVKGYSTLTHRLKAELFLKHLGWSDDAINAALIDLKVRSRKKKEEETGEAPPADEDIICRLVPRDSSRLKIKRGCLGYISIIDIINVTSKCIE